MKAQRLLGNAIRKVALATVALGALFLFAGAPAAKANDWDDCHRPYAYSNPRYHEALERREAARRVAYYRHERRDARYGWDRR